MDDRVTGHLNDYRIRKVDYCCNGVVTVVGVFLMLFAAWLFLVAPNPVGRVSILYGGAAFFGAILTVVSIKWMVESCQKSIEYDRWISQLES